MKSLEFSLRSKTTMILIGIVLSVGVLSSPTLAQSSADDQPADSITTDLTELSLEELMNVEVTSVSKKKQKLSESAAAIYVITQEDIRRSGVTSIPEALRLAPGIQVARVDSSQWAISARGFNDVFANKLLVLMDGRTVYNPIFAGVFWNVQDTMIEDIDRIEVIRGPGASLWGVNAVNGVINIITKSAKETQNGLVSGIGGTEEGIASLRYGKSIGEHLHVRGFAKYLNWGTSFNPNGAHDDWHMSRGGFKAEWEHDTNSTLTVQGDYYDGEAGQQITTPTLTIPFSQTTVEDVDLSGGNILARWQHTIHDGSDLALQFYYDRFNRDDSLALASVDTVDVDFQHRFSLPLQQEIIWGAGYRHWSTDIQGSVAVSTVPAEQPIDLFSGFVQDEITLLPDLLRVTLGTKVSHNPFTGVEWQPSGRVLWKPAPAHTLWGAVSRAVRIPSVLAENMQGLLPAPAPPSRLLGNSSLKAESVQAFELGYRVSPIEQFSLDISAFYNIYENLIGTQLVAIPPAVTVPTFQFMNDTEAHTWGFEVAGDLQLLEWWKWRGAYTFIKLDFDNKGTAIGIPSLFEGTTPENQLMLRSLIDLPLNMQFDSWLQYVDELPGRMVPSYVELDLRLGWKPWKGFELSLVGQNLLHSHHLEFRNTNSGTQVDQIERRFYGKITWQF